MLFGYCLVLEVSIRGPCLSAHKQLLLAKGPPSQNTVSLFTYIIWNPGVNCQINHPLIVTKDLQHPIVKIIHHFSGVRVKGKTFASRVFYELLLGDQLESNS